MEPTKTDCDCETPKVTLEIQRDETNPKIAIVRNYAPRSSYRLMNTMAMVADIGAWAGAPTLGGSWSGPQVSPAEYAAARMREWTAGYIMYSKTGVHPSRSLRPRPKNCCRAKRRGRTQCR